MTTGNIETSDSLKLGVTIVFFSSLLNFWSNWYQARGCNISEGMK